MMARALATNGANKVFIVGRRTEALERVAATVPGGTIVPVIGDVTSKDSLSKCVEQVQAQVSHIDVVIANSGISGPPTPQYANPKTKEPLPFDQFHANLWKPDMDAVTATYHTNITGVFYTAVAFMPLLHAANQARKGHSDFPRAQIIATASIGAYNRVNMGNFTYGPSKAAVAHLMKQLATSMTPYGIRCNVIAPGLYLTVSFPPASLPLPPPFPSFEKQNRR